VTGGGGGGGVADRNTAAVAAAAAAAVVVVVDVHGSTALCGCGGCDGIIRTLEVVVAVGTIVVIIGTLEVVTTTAEAEASTFGVVVSNSKVRIKIDPASSVVVVGDGDTIAPELGPPVPQ
jgi:hypothetical protein